MQAMPKKKMVGGVPKNTGFPCCKISSKLGGLGGPGVSLYLLYEDTGHP